MKIRSENNKKKRFVIKLIYLGFAVYLFLLLLSIRYEILMYFSFVGLAVGIFGLIYVSFGIKCPKCKQGWGYMALYGGFFLFLRGLNFVHFAAMILTPNFNRTRYGQSLGSKGNFRKI